MGIKNGVRAAFLACALLLLNSFCGTDSARGFELTTRSVEPLPGQYVEGLTGQWRGTLLGNKEYGFAVSYEAISCTYRIALKMIIKAHELGLKPAPGIHASEIIGDINGPGFLANALQRPEGIFFSIRGSDGLLFTYGVDGDDKRQFYDLARVTASEDGKSLRLCFFDYRPEGQPLSNYDPKRKLYSGQPDAAFLALLVQPQFYDESKAWLLTREPTPPVNAATTDPTKACLITAEDGLYRITLKTTLATGQPDRPRSITQIYQLSGTLKNGESSVSFCHSDEVRAQLCASVQTFWKANDPIAFAKAPDPQPLIQLAQTAASPVFDATEIKLLEVRIE